MDVQETYTAEAEALTAWIIADMKPGEERGDAMPRARRSSSTRYRAQDGAPRRFGSAMSGL